MEKIKYFKSKNQSENTKPDIKRIIKGVILAFVFTIIFLVLFSVIFTYTDISLSVAGMVGSTIFYAGATVSGIVSSFNLKSRGWLHGVIAGCIYVCAIWIVNLLAGMPGTKVVFPLMKIIVSALLGSIGGIIGVNLHFNSKGRR